MPQKTATDVAIGTGAAFALPAWAVYSQEWLAYIALVAGCLLALGRLFIFVMELYQRFKRCRDCEVLKG